MAQDWFNNIEDAVSPVLLEQEAKNDCKYNRDLVAYSANGKRCVYIYDEFLRGCGYNYLLIASQKINDQWSKGEVLQFDGNDGIDAMVDAEGYLTQL